MKEDANRIRFINFCCEMLEKYLSEEGNENSIRMEESDYTEKKSGERE